MPLGAGKYDDVATFVRKTTKAKGVVIIILEGKEGSAVSTQTESIAMARELPKKLRDLADNIEKDLPT